jgi:hypothetical protein
MGESPQPIDNNFRIYQNVDKSIEMSDLECEWGSSRPIRFATSKLYDSENNEMDAMCKCGKPATYYLIGKDSYLFRCHECMYNE